jgi:hypothetical protein
VNTRLEFFPLCMQFVRDRRDWLMGDKRRVERFAGFILLKAVLFRFLVHLAYLTGERFMGHPLLLQEQCDECVRLLNETMK